MNCTMMTMMIRYERLEVEGRFAEYLRRLMTRKEERAHSHRTMMTMMIRYERLEVEGSFAEYLQRLMTRKEERAHSHRTMMTMMIRYERLEEGSFDEYLRRLMTRRGDGSQPSYRAPPHKQLRGVRVPYPEGHCAGTHSRVQCWPPAGVSGDAHGPILYQALPRCSERQAEQQPRSNSSISKV